MADDVPIRIFFGKLQKVQRLAENRLLFAPLRNKMDKIVNELKLILTFLEQETASRKTLMDQLLPDLYSAEYIIESFLLKATHRRQKGVVNKIIKMPLFVFAPWSQVQLSFKLKEIEKKIRAVSIQFGKVDMTVSPIPQALGLVERHYDEMPDLLVGPYSGRLRILRPIAYHNCTTSHRRGEGRRAHRWKRESTNLCKRGSPFCRSTTIPDHSKRKSTKQFHNSKIKFRLVYGVSIQEEMLATL